MPPPALPLIVAPGPGHVVAWDGGAPVRADQFVSAVERLARRLPATRCALLLCQDRVRFALALCAALRAGIEVLLPPGQSRASIAAVMAGHQPGFAFVDRAGTVEQLPEVVVDESFVADPGGAMPCIPADQAAVTLFTSGTTGVPAPHRKTWGSLARGAAALGRRIGFAPGSTVIGAVPPQHMWGLEATVMLPLQCGGVLHPAVPLLPEDVAACVRAVPMPRWLVLTPIHIRACLQAGVRLGEASGILSSTSPLDPQDAAGIERGCGAPLIEIYGSTETGAAATRRTATESSFRLLDDLEATPVAAGIVFRGGHLDGEVCLGDRAEVDADGHLSLRGRDADMVKVGGKRASLSDLTQELRRIPGVVDAVYLRDQPSGRLASRLIALVVAPGLDRETIQTALRERVDPVFLPRPLHLVAALPRTSLGKLRGDELRGLLRDLDAGESGREAQRR